MLSANTILQNRYRVIRQLGQGGMGAVYEALDQRVNAIVAIKETLVGRDEESRRAFEREAGLLANLHHQALPKVMDYFAEGDGEFLVMEFVPGYDLAELLELRGAPFDVNQVVRWADELLKVLQYLHGSNPPVLHRDIKPSNLKLTKQGEIFLLDFGLAKGAAGQMPTMLTSRSVHGYTPIYAPLEQIHGKGTDPRSDLYSLGATLYHLLTATPPVDAPTRFDAIEDDKPDPLRPACELNPRVPASIAAVIHQAMAISRKQRYASAAEMRKALRQAEDEERRKEEEQERLRQESERKEREAEERRRQAEEVARAAERERQEEARRLEAEARRQKELRERKELEAARHAELERQRQADEERRRLEAERQRRETEEAARQRAAAEEASRIEVERRREEEEIQRREAKSSELTQPSPPPTVLAQAESAAPQDGVKTWKAPPPEQSYMSAHDAPPSSPASEDNIEEPAPNDERRRVMILAATAVITVIVVGAVVVWLTQKKKDANQSSPSNLNQSKAGQQTKNTESETQRPAGMVYVPGGEFMMGLNAADGGDEYERPAHKVSVAPFYIDIYEVTCEEYKKFLDAVPGQAAPQGWVNRNYPDGSARKPVTGIKWGDANAYAEWAGKRLPTEEEWEFAARGTDGRRYPWGNEWKAGLANADKASKGMADVGSYKGASPFGAFDMVGNAWEWTASPLKAYPGGQLPGSPASTAKVLRGGSYLSNRMQATTTYRYGWPANEASSYTETGFRCAKDVAAGGKEK